MQAAPKNEHILVAHQLDTGKLIAALNRPSLPAQVA
jgi:hypothetical protein